MEETRPEKYGIRSLHYPKLYIGVRYNDLWTSDPKVIRTFSTFQDAETFRTTKIEHTHYGTEVCYLGAS